ncbi:MAG TPA: hypothetical protein P5205_14335 [Candidatus Paceibacterota bacterium]|nr:hypothetical protein [Verrucomicrobiota bacterium]HSA11541.1 hypothetical protein [Candidatus Paceibacterota bacterium]
MTMKTVLCAILATLQLLVARNAGAQMESAPATERTAAADHVKVAPVTATSTGSGRPAIAVSPRRLDFASVPVGRIIQLSLTVQNAGAGTLSGEAKVSAPFRIVEGSRYALRDSQNQVITLQYAPQSAGMNITALSLTGGGGASITVVGSAFLTRRTAPARPASPVVPPTGPTPPQDLRLLAGWQSQWPQEPSLRDFRAQSMPGRGDIHPLHPVAGLISSAHEVDSLRTDFLVVGVPGPFCFD